MRIGLYRALNTRYLFKRVEIIYLVDELFSLYKLIMRIQYKNLLLS